MSKSVGVFGATSRIGQELLPMLFESGYNVHAMVRKANGLSPLLFHYPNQLTTYLGDCSKDSNTIERIVSTSDIQVIVLGAYSNEPEDQIICQTTQLVVEAMKKLGKRRIILISSAGVGNNEDQEKLSYRFVFKKFVLNNCYADLRNAENFMLANSQFLDYTIAQLPLLSNGPLTKDYIVNLSNRMPSVPLRILSRKNVAHLLLTIIEESQDGKYKNTYVSATEPKFEGKIPYEDGLNMLKPQIPKLMSQLAWKTTVWIGLPSLCLMGWKLMRK